MTIIIQNSDLIGSGPQISLNTTVDLVVTEGTVIGSTSGTAITGTDSSNVTINGSVYGISHAISLSGNNNRLVIGTTGYVGNSAGSTSNIASIFVSGDSAELINHGSVDGGSALTIASGLNGYILNTGRVTGNNAFAFDRLSSSSTAIVVNTGFAFGESYGVRFFGGDSSITYSITNTGILGGNTLGVLTGTGDDEVINSGQIIGGIEMSTGNDVFDGRGGTVIGAVKGGSGDDTYIVDDGNLQLVETAISGIDEVRAAVNWKLGDNFENLTLIGNNDTRGVGNLLDNILTGNSGDNTLRGGGGKDTLTGSYGDDTLRGGSGADIVNGGDGNDRLVGGSGKDKLYGGEGDDVLIGGVGEDKLWGGDGLDMFIFSRVGHSTNSSAADTIKDFEVGFDRIDLSKIIAGEFTHIGSSSFSGAGHEVRWVTDGVDTIVRIDVDGSGSTDMKILVDDVTVLTADDFIL